MKVTVTDARCTLGVVGDVVDVDTGKYNVRALVRSGLVAVVKPKKKAAKKASPTGKADD